MKILGLYKRYWWAFKEVRDRINNERRFDRFTQKMFIRISRPEVITDEIVYSTGGPVKKTVKMLNLTSLPIIDSDKLIKVTQIPCSPLEYVPCRKYIY